MDGRRVPPLRLPPHGGDAPALTSLVGVVDADGDADAARARDADVARSHGGAHTSGKSALSTLWGLVFRRSSKRKAASDADAIAKYRAGRVCGRRAVVAALAGAVGVFVAAPAACVLAATHGLAAVRSSRVFDCQTNVS
jgi:hypothetical protein